MSLDPEMLLQRAPNVAFRVDSSNYVCIDAPEGEILCGPHGLAVLETFASPITFHAALASLSQRTTGTQDWIALTSTIVQLHEKGILRDLAHALPAVVDGDGFDAAPIHTRMLNDYERTDQFIAGLDDSVKIGDVVLDIGTGTGVLSIAAARAGARHVYAVEASSIGPCAKAVFEANGLSERITLVPGWSTSVELPEQADVLVTETIGNEPLGERLLEIVLDARQRLLKPGATILPSRLRIMALALSVPDSILAEYTFVPSCVEDWKTRYNIDFTPLVEAAARVPHSFYVKPHRAQTWSALAEPMILSEINLSTVDTLRIESTVTVPASQAGRLSGIMVYSDIELGEGRWLSRHPAAAGELCSWRSPIWPVAEPLTLAEGDAISVTYRYRVPGTDDSVQVTRA
ncbi:MAG: hypothetical protein ACI8PT_000273 [Gammaproteobacteria bacterium]|jgi:hypothetical protein